MKRNYLSWTFAAVYLLGGCVLFADGNLTWSKWGPWSSCSVTCGYGTFSRIAYLMDSQGQRTNKTIVQNTGCYVDKSCPVDGNWTMWSPWGPCSKICGQGQWTRSRECANPTPANGGMDCVGMASETEECNLQPCPTIPPGFILSSCTKEDFMCSSNIQCVSALMRCDRKLQCHDGSDEKGCRYYINGQNRSPVFVSLIIIAAVVGKCFARIP